MERSELSTDECWERLGGATVGRLAVSTDDGLDIFPINFTVHDAAVYLRTAPGSKLMTMAHHPGVAFEADGVQAGMHWSVVVKGTALRLADDTEIEQSGVLHLHTASPTSKLNFVRITPTSVTGRQFSLLDRLAEPE